MNTKQETQETQRQLGDAENAFRLGDIVLAEKLINLVLASDPNNPKGNELLAYICGIRGELDRAFQLLKVATASIKASPESHYYLGNLCIKRGQYEEAIIPLKRSLELSGDFFEGLHDLGVAMAAIGSPEEALAIFEKAESFNSDSHELFYNIGRAFDDLERFGEAVAAYNRAVAIYPDCAEAWYNKGKIFSDSKRYDEALACYSKALAVRPDNGYYYGSWLITRMLLCDWEQLGDSFKQLFTLIENGNKAPSPFVVLATPASAALQKKCSEIFIADNFPPAQLIGCKAAKTGRRRKVKIGYYSADFHNHATTYLIAELFELHDRSRFELVGFSFGPDRQDGMRKRVSSSMDRFIDVRNKSDRAIAELSRALEIDIAVDLKGHTQDARTGIFARRAAPIQVSYLGYPGTMGASYIDYLIADPVVIDQEMINYYSEKIVFMPHSYQINDRSRKISNRKFTRAELGLPERGFVFACFNFHYKITPDIFDVWMNILRKVPDSVLWLFAGSDSVIRNLQKEAESRGVTRNRLVFAGHMVLSDHLARHKLADLFLDTFYCNAHTTASDALWAGLPVLTRLGHTFAGRVAASLLHSVGLNELIAYSTEEYEVLACELATHPNKLADIKSKLANNRLTCPLFDAPLFTKHIEAVYLEMYERHAAGMPPCHLYKP
jgi:predicted O-linked N-acetylglucosamine transferase (SPINDLY family)